jgi:hypothetical protein
MFHINLGPSIIFVVALVIQCVISARWGAKAGMFSYVLAFLLPVGLWVLGSGYLFLRSGPRSAEFGSVFGEGFSVALSLDAIWMPIGLIGLLLGWSAGRVWLWVKGLR